MHYKSRLLAVLVAVGATPFAMASDGTINFNGELKAETCVISVNGAASPTVVTLPTISTKSLSAAGRSAGQTGFSMQLSQCGSSSKTVAAYFEAGSSVDPGTGNLKNVSGSATQVQLQLVDAANGAPIKAGQDVQKTATSRVDIDPAGNATLPYAVQYFATGETTPGSVISSVTYSINYQ